MTAVWTGDERPRPRPLTLEERAEAFHADNPHVMSKLLEIARELRRRGVRKAGVKLLFERLRWISQVETTGDLFKLNNSYASWYARRLMEVDPSLAGLFETRSSAHDPNYFQRVVKRAARVLRAQRSDDGKRTTPSAGKSPREVRLF